MKLGIFKTTSVTVGVCFSTGSAHKNSSDKQWHMAAILSFHVVDDPSLRCAFNPFIPHTRLYMLLEFHSGIGIKFAQFLCRLWNVSATKPAMLLYFNFLFNEWNSCLSIEWYWGMWSALSHVYYVLHWSFVFSHCLMEIDVIDCLLLVLYRLKKRGFDRKKMECMWKYPWKDQTGYLTQAYIFLFLVVSSVERDILFWCYLC